MLDAWQAAKCRADEKNKAEAKQRTSGLLISLTQRQSFEQVSLRQSLEDEGFPASGVVERRLQEVEQGNPTSEPLSDVASSAEVSADAGNIVLDADGTFKMRRSTQKVPLPNDSEELAHLHHREVAEPEQPVACDGVFGGLARALGLRLGPPRLGIEPGRRRSPSLSSLAGGAQLRALSSSRGAAFGYVRGQELEGCHVRGAPLHRARDVHFIAPALVSKVGDGGRAAFRVAPCWPRRGHRRYGKNEDKGKGKGNGKDKGKGNGKGGGKSKFDPNLPTTTPDGKQICFAYNNQHERCPHGKACRREHVCRRCLEPHPLHMCDENFRAPEATGA